MSGEWLSRRQAADILGVEPGTVGAWEANGLLREMRIALRESPQGHPEYRAKDVRRARGEMTTDVRVWLDGERVPAMEEALRARLSSQPDGETAATDAAEPHGE